MTTLTCRDVRAATGLFLAVCALPLRAVDGIVLINQNAALAGNVTPGDTPGFPVTITLPGSYRLSGNLTVPDANTTGIFIHADGVTIDLNGFSIIGPALCSGPPIRCTSTGTGIGIDSLGLRTAVLNGAVQGMGSDGIRLLIGFNRVERVHVFNNGSTGILGSNDIVSSCIAEFNGGDGISVFGGKVSDSAANDNGRSGISYVASTLILNNQARSNDASGIVHTKDFLGEGSVFNGNSAVGNGGVGILAVCPSLITATCSRTTMPVTFCWPGRAVCARTTSQHRSAAPVIRHAGPFPAGTVS